jgi:small conductance mechanosensitive channel
MPATALERMFDRTTDWLLTSGLRSFLVLVGTVVLIWAARRGLQRFGRLIAGVGPSPEQVKRAQTLTHVLESVAAVALGAVGGLLILSELGLDMKPILTAAGIGGLAIGFGAQNLVKDVITGFLMLLENQVRVGDVVKIGATGGMVEAISMRTLTLRDLHGSVHVIPHGSVQQVTNLTRDFSCYLFDIGVAYREDVDEVMAVLREVGEELRADPAFAPDILEPLEILGVDRFADSAVIIRARIMTRPIQQWRIGREMNRRIKKAFDARGIEIPFRHVTVYAGRPKTGDAPPLPVRLVPAPE